jgi:hypothetical protein
MASKSRRALAAPFVVTLAALPLGCGPSAQQGPNYAPNPPAQTVEPTPGTAPPATTAAPPPKTNIRKNPDGTCWADSTDFKCPPEPATCNPPPPRKVDCPK